MSRRRLLVGAAGVAGGMLIHTRAHAIDALAQAAGAAPPDPTKVLGHPPTELGVRSSFVTTMQRHVVHRLPNGESETPLQELRGIITPADLHFERHHAGVPNIDPHQYKLLVHGMVERPTVFTLEALQRFPSVSRICFIECSGNGYRAWQPSLIKPEWSPSEIDGLTSTSEWTGVPVATLLREVGVKPGAKWFLAEGGDAAVMTRSIPLSKGMDDALIAYGQNGEPIRPEQGYPARLLLPGWEGNSNVKWIRRIEVSDQPFMTREETSKYTDPLADCTARLFSFEMDAKSIITFPAYPMVLPEKGWWEITGLAWSGRGRIAKVDVSTDGGAHWAPAQLQEPVLPKCHTRFRCLWNWTGGETSLMSRAVDETGYVQPMLSELRAARGPGSFYHLNNVRVWRVAADGKVVLGLEA